MHTINAKDDFTISDHGSVWLIDPTSREARAWLEEHTHGLWFGGALAVEPRYVGEIVEGLRDAGFVGGDTKVRGRTFERIAEA